MIKCPSCGFDSPREMHFCGLCGTRLTVACAQCGFDNPLDYRFCGMCGTALAREAAEPAHQPPQPAAEIEALAATAPSTVALAGERRVISVIVTDLTDSTNLLEDTGTESWVELMNRILHILESEIYRFGGEVGQFRGDGLVAFFGANVAHEDDPERAVLAALSMQRAFAKYVRELSQPEARALQMRVGVNTGEVIAAARTDRQNWEETAMGIAVTIAARMETAAEPGTVLVSEYTHRLVESQFTWQPLGEFSVKGISQPIKVYRPQSHITDRELIPFVGEFPEMMTRIGRASEFHTLKRCVTNLFEGRGHIATLSGDKGSGKSFLLNELRRYFTHREALLAETQVDSSPISLDWLRGHCRSYSQTWPYSMWFDLFHDWLGMRSDEPRESKRAILRSHSVELWGERFDEHYPYLAALLSLPVEEEFIEKIRHLDGERLRERCFLAVRSWIETMSQGGPLVLAFSDVQWADDSSLALLKYCLPICDNEAVLVILSFRAERESPLREFYPYLQAEYPHRLTTVKLPPLTHAESRELIDQLIGAETLPAEISNLIIRHSEGYPYYILELIRSLIAGGVLDRQGDSNRWHLARTVTTLDLPDSLHSLLLSRIDLLSTQERSVLQCAAVIGQVFWMNMLDAILEEPPTLKADIASLQRAQLIIESGRIPELGMQYAFKSPLIRETVYESLLNTHRISHHLKVAEFLENDITPDVLGNYDGLLAYHFHMAGNLRKELFYTVLAAEHEQRIYANAEALQDYNRAMELLDALENEIQLTEKNRSIQTQRFEVLNGRRKVLFQLGRVEASRVDARALLPLARSMSDDPVWLVDALFAQADNSTENRQELIPGLQMLQEALELSRHLGDPTREMQSLVRIASIRFVLRDQAWQESAEQALSLAGQLGDLKTEVNLLLRIGGAYGMDDLHRNRDYLQAALIRSERLKDKATEIRLLNALGEQYERDGDYYRQLVEYEQKRLQISREIGNNVAEGNALMFCGQIQALYLGDYENGLELQRQALRRWEGMTGRLFPLLRIAQIETALGHYPEAFAALDAANPLGEKVVEDIGRAGLGLVTAILNIALGDEERLHSALESTSQIQRMATDNLVSRQYQMSAACEAAAAHLKLADIHQDIDHQKRDAYLRRALDSSQAALDLYRRFGFVQIVECSSEEILFRHSQVLALNGRPAKSIEYLERAHTEMMRKYDLIPADSSYRKTFMENIQLHRDIQTAYSTQSADSNPVA